MASVKKEDMGTITGLKVNSPLVSDDGADFSYACFAHQIKWGNSKFNNTTFGGTTEGLLNSIENAINTVEFDPWMVYTKENTEEISE